jgi:hypothetical protein
MDIKTSIEKILPLISEYSTPVATALGMPYAGVIISALCHLFGVETPDKLPDAISGDAQASIKIKQIEAEIVSIKAKSDLEQSEIDDRKSARDMSGKKVDRKDWIVHYLALLVSMGFFGYVIAFNCHYVKFDKEVFHNLVVMVTIILMYYF